ncbi:MAG TPA: BrnT family toxin [Enteractinococcus helveticum]|uniref:BrnT family toxin n=1 Tax=Enteractinococcus helveticum TaxID=1837282 RepID=A0A921FNV4_9MICC|nr:BrnT family toxin [Enteractinococcus helveticum]
MEFEFNPLKSNTNKLKHGIEFFDAQMLWEDVNHVEIPARTEGEPRWLVIGQIAETQIYEDSRF